jgi:hypothetical protein
VGGLGGGEALQVESKGVTLNVLADLGVQEGALSSSSSHNDMSPFQKISIFQHPNRMLIGLYANPRKMITVREKNF